MTRPASPVNRVAIGRAAKLTGLQKGNFAFDGTLVGAEPDSRHQLMRERLQFAARYVRGQIERHPQ